MPERLFVRNVSYRRRRHAVPCRVTVTCGLVQCFRPFMHLSTHICVLQAALLAGVGLQRLGLSELSGHLGLPYPQLLALFNKVRRRAAPLRRCADASRGQGSPAGGSATAALTPGTCTGASGFRVRHTHQHHKHRAAGSCTADDAAAIRAAARGGGGGCGAHAAAAVGGAGAGAPRGRPGRRAGRCRAGTAVANVADSMCCPSSTARQACVA